MSTSAQLSPAQLPSPITKRPDLAADVPLVRLGAARQHLHVHVDDTRYLSSCVLQPAIPTVHAAGTKRVVQIQMRGLLSFSSPVSGRELRFSICRISHAARLQFI